MKLRVLVEHGDTNWAASCESDEIGGVVVATAATRAEVIAKFRSALRFHLEGVRATGRDVPAIEGIEVLEVVELVAA
jgi:predicted RNase H-like HicB family nuclease